MRIAVGFLPGCRYTSGRCRFLETGNYHPTSASDEHVTRGYGRDQTAGISVRCDDTLVLDALGLTIDAGEVYWCLGPEQHSRDPLRDPYPVLALRPRRETTEAASAADHDHEGRK